MRRTGKLLWKGDTQAVPMDCHHGKYEQRFHLEIGSSSDYNALIEQIKRKYKLLS